MVPLLLLLLLPGALAEEVCFNISDSKITFTMASRALTVSDDIIEQPGQVKCLANNSSCIFMCNSSNSFEFNGSRPCTQASLSPDGVAITIDPYYNCTYHLCNSETLLWLIGLLNRDDSYQESMMQLLYFWDSCPLLFKINNEIKGSYIRDVLERVVTSLTADLDEPPVLYKPVHHSAVRAAHEIAERQIIHNIMRESKLGAGYGIHQSLRSYTLHVAHISEDDLNSENPRIQIEAPQLLPQNQSSIPDVWLPVSALKDMPQERRLVGLVSYIHHRQFQEEISSMVLRIETLGKQDFRHLKTPIKMIFPNIPPLVNDNNSWLQCNYFDENDGLWKTDGCITNITQTEITCHCDHATPFAILLMRDPISEVHWKILSSISYIGCGLSALFTALSLVIYVFSRNHRLDLSISIHVSLSGALFLLNSTFLLTEWGATVEPDWVCVFVAAFMHYSLLCCFTWMAIEALHLYLLLIKVFNTYFKHYLAKLSFAGWGIPAVIVAVSLSVKDFKQFYGVTQMKMADTNQTNAICWITDDSFFYSLNLVYFTLIFIFNTGILIAVASKVCKMKRAKPATQGDHVRFGETCRSIITVMGITCLMGTTWGLAFLGAGYVNYPILYLFCILNSTQGFFIFLWICLSAKKQRKTDMEERLTSSAVKTSAVKFD